MEMGDISKYFKLLFSNPKKIISIATSSSSIKRAIISLIIISELMFILGSLMLFTTSGYLGFTDGGIIDVLQTSGISQEMLYMLMIMFLFIGIIFTPILLILSVFFSVGILYLLLKLFKGEGTFTELFHNFAVILIPLSIILGVVSNILLLLITKLSISITLLQIIFGVILFGFNLFYLTIILKTVGRFSTTRAILCWLIPILGITLFFFSMLFIISNSLGFNPYSISSGSNILPRSELTNLLSNGQDIATIKFGFINYNTVPLKINITTLKILNNGVECEVLEYGLQGRMENTLNTWEISPKGTFIIDVIINGTKCGAELTGEQRFEYSIELISPKKMLSGQVSGKFRKYGESASPTDVSMINGSYPIIDLNTIVSLNVNETVILSTKDSASTLTLIKTGVVGNIESCEIKIQNPKSDIPVLYPRWKGIPDMFPQNGLLVVNVTENKCDVIAYDANIKCVDSDNTKIEVITPNHQRFLLGPDRIIRGNLTLQDKYVIHDICANEITTIDESTGYQSTIYEPSDNGNVLVELTCFEGTVPYRFYIGCNCDAGACI